METLRHQDKPGDKLIFNVDSPKQLTVTLGDGTIVKAVATPDHPIEIVVGHKPPVIDIDELAAGKQGDFASNDN